MDGLLFRIISPGGWCSGRDLNPGSPARKAGMLGRTTPPEHGLPVCGVGHLYFFPGG